jgi:hypothetical protein
LEAECSALILGVQTDQTVDVVHDDQVIASWVFNKTENLGLRSVRIEPSLANAERARTLRLTFRPRNVVKASDLTAETQDDRELGLGLWRTRLSTV